MNEATRNGSARDSSESQEGSEQELASNADSDVESLRKAVATAQDAARSQRDQYLRAMAELDNVRKRAERDVESAHRYALEKFVGELLPVRDGLELAARQGAQVDAKALFEGQQATLKLLDRALDKAKVKILDPLGDKFDPAQHEAVLMQPSDTSEPDRVLQVVQTGYELNGRLLRPARVIVAKSKDG